METKKTLYRDTTNNMLGGVASGLSEYMGWDVTIVRLAFVFCLFAVQGSLLAYILAWILIPNKNKPSEGPGIGKIILLIIICAIPMLLLTIAIWSMFFGMITAFL